MTLLAEYVFGTASATNVAAGLTFSDVDIANVSSGAFDNTTSGAASAPNLRVYPKGGVLTLADAVSLASYYEFTVTPNAGKKFSLTDIALDASRAGATGNNRGFEIRTSEDNYASAKFTVTNLTVTQPNWAHYAPSLIIADRTTALTIRVYVASDPNTQGHNYDTIVINGSVADIVVDLPDLVIDAVTPDTGSVGTPVTFIATVRNAGSAATPAVPHVVRFVVDGNTLLSSSYTTSIAPSGTAQISSDTTWTPTAVGSFTVDAEVNYDQSIQEGNYLNNTASLGFTVIQEGAGVTSFNGRIGDVTFQQADGDAFFLTQAEGDARYALIGGGSVSSVFGRVGNVVALQADYDAFFLTPAEGDARYLTQDQANSQGMPAVELGAVGSGGPVREVNANFTLRTPTTGADFYQLYFNVGASAVTASAPAGYTITGSNSIPANTSALFVKRAGVSQFRRVS